LVLVMGRQGAHQRFGGLSLAVAIALPVVSQTDPYQPAREGAASLSADLEK
jgi:hypothetical protein